MFLRILDLYFTDHKSEQLFCFDDSLLILVLDSLGRVFWEKKMMGLGLMELNLPHPGERIF